MKKIVVFVLAGIAGIAFGATFESSVFSLDTWNLTGQASSAVFTNTTDALRDQQMSGVFICATDCLRDQQASPVFLCDSQSPAFGSAVFMADTHTFPVDSDGNGLPNIWEMLHFNVTTGTVATADVDDDGNSNRDEYISGTDPWDDQSIFEVYLDGNTGLLEWNTVLNRLYTLEHTYNLTNSFTPVPGYEDIPGMGDIDYYLGVSDEATNEFFRVQVRLVE